MPQRKPPCPNPLFLQWLGEWRDQALDLKLNNPRHADSKAHYTLKKAYDSMSCYPLPLATGLDAKRLDGIGDMIANRLQKRLEQYCRDNNLPPPESSSSQSSAAATASQQSPKRRTTKRKSSQGDSAVDEGEAGGAPARKARKSRVAVEINAAAGSNKTKAESATYVPRYRSGPYAILLTLLNAYESGRESGLMTKANVIKEAQPQCDSSFDMPEQGKHYTAWASMSNLLKRELVYKSGTRYCLTEDGVTLAMKMRQVVSVEENADTEEMPPQPAVHDTQSRGVAGHAWPQTNTAEQRFVEQIPFQFWYLDSDDRRVRRALDANVLVEEKSGFTLLYKIEYLSLQANHPFASLLVPTGQTSVDGNLVARMREQQAPDECPGIDVRLLLIGGPGITSQDGLPHPQSASDLPPPLDNPTFGILDHPELVSSSSQPLPRSSTGPPPTVSGSTGISSSQPLTSSSESPRVMKSFSNPLPASASAAPLTRSVSAPEPSPSTFPAFQPVVLPAGSFEVICLVDSREIRLRSDRDYFHSELRRRGVLCEQQVLEIGDVTWIARRADTGQEIGLDFILERKRLDDLVASIKDGRFVEQKFRLQNSGASNIIYLVEEHNMQAAVDFGLNAIYSAMASTLMNGFFVKRTASVDESVLYLQRLTQMLRSMYMKEPLYVIPDEHVDRSTFIALKRHLASEDPSHTYHVTFDRYQYLNTKRRLLTLSDLFMKFLMCVRGISAEKAQEVASKYKTPRGFMEAFDAFENDVAGKEAMLKDTGQPGTAVASRRKKIGAALSKKMSEIWTSLELEDFPPASGDTREFSS